LNVVVCVTRYVPLLAPLLKPLALPRYDALATGPRDRNVCKNLRDFHNWLKKDLIMRNTSDGESLLDLGCGQGGDLLKWGVAGLGHVCGVDISQQSLVELKQRYDAGRAQGKMKFTVQTFWGDCSKDMRDQICAHAPEPNRMFDCVSSMFSLHYNFSSTESINNFFSNVTCALKPGGRFFGTFCSGEAVLNLLMEAQCSHYQDTVEDFAVTFKASDEKIFSPGDGIGLPYQFRLGAAVEDIDEYVTLWSTLSAAAARHGLVGGLVGCISGMTSPLCCCLNYSAGGALCRRLSAVRPGEAVCQARVISCFSASGLLCSLRVGPRLIRGCPET
jgi:SAM-dependent methyltransferase